MKKIRKNKFRIFAFVKSANKYQKKLKANGYIVYDRTGRILERVSFEGAVYHEVEGDDYHGLLQIKKFVKKPFITKHIYKYKGDELIAEFYDNWPINLLTRKKLYKYKDDKLVEELFYMPANKLCQRRNYKYKNDRLVYSKYLWANGRIIHENFCKYNKKDRKTEWICCDNDLKDKSVFRYHYDKEGREIFTDHTSRLAGQIVWRYKYDRDGNLVEEKEHDRKGNLKHVSIYSHNENGQKIKSEYLYQGKIQEGVMIWEYDKKGNRHATKNYDNALEHSSISNHNKYGHVVSTIDIDYYCDCTGVREVPYQLETYEYEYY